MEIINVSEVAYSVFSFHEAFDASYLRLSSHASEGHNGRWQGRMMSQIWSMRV